MAALFVGNQPAVQVLATLGVGALLVIAGCLLADPLLCLLDRVSRLGRVNRVVVLLFVVQLTMFGGAKHGGTNDVNDAENGEAVSSPLHNGIEPPLTSGGDTASPLPDADIVRNLAGTDHAMSSPLLMGLARSRASDEDIASPLPVADVVRGYRLEGVTTNEGCSYAMPADGAVRGTWHLSGAYEDVQKVALDGFAFPLGNNLCTSLWAYTWGKVRPRLKNATNEVAAVGAPMSAIPGVSQFWTAATTNDSYLLTWENFAAGRISGEAMSSSLQDGIDPSLTSGEDTASPFISAQIELHRNGDFVTRSNNVECVYRRVNPDDWDDDGLPNEEDSDPMAPADETQFGPHQTLPSGSDTNYYYWVDLVVGPANARVVFEGDGESDWPDPSFVAKAGETNRVFLLIGKTYSVRCPMPIQCVDKEDEDVEVYPGSDGLLVCWDIRMEFVTSSSPQLSARPLLRAAGDGDGTGVRIIPGRAGGGLFSWPGSFCCYNFAADGSPVFNCQGNCGCGGNCNTGSITYTYVGYSRDFDGWSCSCRSSGVDDDDPHEGDDDSDEPSPPPAGVSIYFSETAVIFEDEYHPSSNLTVQARSTTTRLCCSVYGGEYGGSVLITATGIDNRLDCVAGSQTFPVYRQLEPQETFAFTNSYKAVAQSGSANDIVVTGTFIENDTDESFGDEAKATAIRVEFSPDKRAPANDSSGRHKYGVNEVIHCHQYPSSPQLSWNLTAGTMFENNTKYRCPLDIAIGNPIKVSCGGAEFTPVISVVTPNQVVARNVRYDDFDAPLGEAGSVALIMELFIGPFDVDFREIAVEEVPDSGGTGLGYFGRRDLAAWTSHTIANGAGRWHNVTEGNKMGEPEVYDQAGVTETLSRMNSSGLFVDDPNCGWQHGTIDMPNPFGWNVKDTTSGQPVGRFAENTHDFIELEDYGKCSVQKLQNEVYRLTNGCVYLNGVLK